MDRTKWQPYVKRITTINARQLTERMESSTGIGLVYGEVGDYFIKYWNGDEGIISKKEFEDLYQPANTKTEEEESE